MAQQGEGWPLGLQPLNARIGLAGNRNNFRSISFNTILTGSPSSSTVSSSDLDSESTWSFFPDKSTTLGSLLGISSILELSRRSLRGVKAEILKSKKGNKSLFLCLCPRSSPDDDENEENPPSLGHFLAVERRAAKENRRNQSLPVYGPDEFALAQTAVEQNSLFVNGSIAPPDGSISPEKFTERERESRESGHGSGFGSITELFSCMC